MATTLSAMPESFAAGTTLRYTKSYGDYRPINGWTFQLFLAGPSVISDQSSASGDSVTYEISSQNTSTLAPGLYRWIERATNGTDVVDVASGYVNVTLDLAQAAGGDALSRDEKLLKLVDDVLEGRLTTGLESYQIGGRSLSKIPIKELWEIRNQLASRVRQMRAGGRLGRQHALTFRPPS